MLLFTPACGGDKPAPGGGSGSKAQQPAKKKGSAAAKRKKPQRPERVNMVMVKALFGSEPSSPKVDNPITPEKVALGRLLYHEQHLSKNGDISCASCHALDNYGQDGKPTSPGTAGQMGERNTPTVWNAARQFAQFWDYRASTVEEQAVMPVLNPIEHGLGDEAEVVAKIKEKPELVAAFGKAFPDAGDAVTAANFGLAIGAFERTLVTKSRFDKFLDGDSRALTNDEKRGLNTFMQVGCTTCHMSRLLGGSMFQKVGVHKPYPNQKDTGRHKVTGIETDKFLFKVPSLLNVAKTAPYNHDGAVATLAEAVKQMADIQLNVKVTDAQVKDIVSFLEALTGELPAEIVGEQK